MRSVSYTHLDVYKRQALALQGAHIIAKEGKYQRLLRLEYLQAAEQKNACDPIANGQNQQRDAQKQPVVLQQQEAVNEQGNGCLLYTSSKMRMAFVFASLPICKTFLLRYCVFCRFLKGSPFGRAVCEAD